MKNCKGKGKTFKEKEKNYSGLRKRIKRTICTETAARIFIHTRKLSKFAFSYGGFYKFALADFGFIFEDKCKLKRERSGLRDR